MGPKGQNNQERGVQLGSIHLFDHKDLPFEAHEWKETSHRKTSMLHLLANYAPEAHMKAPSGGYRTFFGSSKRPPPWMEDVSEDER